MTSVGWWYSPPDDPEYDEYDWADDMTAEELNIRNAIIALRPITTPPGYDPFEDD